MPPHPVLVVPTNIFVGQPGQAAGTTNAPSLQTWTLDTKGKFVRLGSFTLAMPASVLTSFPGMLAVQETDNTLDLLEDSIPWTLRHIGGGKPNGCWWFDLSHADGNSNRGLWLPLGAYGVVNIPVVK